MVKPEKVERLISKINDGLSNHKEEFLIGLIEIDDESYCELMNFAGDLINKSVYVPRNEKLAIISIALVWFAINEFQKGQFWNEFATRLEIDESDAMKIGKNSFENFCKKNGLYFHVGNKNKGYVTSIFTHAILPNASMPKFFEFLHDLYFRDLEEDYIDAEVEELIQYMHRLFSKYLEDDDISLIVQGSKMTIANQHLPKAFRIAFVKAASVVAPIFERILFYINQSNYGDIVEYLENDRFDIHFEKHIYIIKERLLRSASRKHSAERFKKFHKAQYYYEQGKIYLQIPKQIIDSDYFKRDIFLEVLGHGSVIHREKVSLTKSRLFFKSEQATVCLPAFYSDLEFRLVTDSKIIYSSDDVLNREFIIFDLDGNEVRPKNLTDDTIKVITSAESEVLSDDAQIDTAYVANYRISTVFLNEESLLLIGDKILSTNVAAMRNEICTKRKYCGVTIKDSNKTLFDVYLDIPEIRLRMPYKKTVQDYILSINNKNYQLEDIADCELKLVSDGSGDELGFFRINDCIIKDNIPAHVVIREKGSHRIYLDERVFILRSLRYEFDQKYYYKEKVANIIRLEAENVEFQGASFPQKVNLRLDDNFRIKFKYNSVVYHLIVEIPVLRWRLGDLSSVSSRYDDVWWEEIKEQKLYVKFPHQFSSQQLHVITGAAYEKLQGKKIGDEYKFSIEHLFQVRNQEPVTLGVLIDGKEERITEIHFKPFIKDFFVSYYDKTNVIQGLYAKWKYIGSGDLHVDIIHTPTRNVIKQYVERDNDHLMDRDIKLYYSEHEIEIYQLNEDDFFGGDAERILLTHEAFIVGDPIIVCTKNKLLKGKHCNIEDDKYELSNFYLKDIRFSRKRGLYEATGMYFIRDKYTGKEREWYFTNHNPFLLNPIYVESDKLTFEIIDKDQDGLIYDVKTKYINPREEENNVQRYKLIDTVELEIV
ncbi:hypothetical protein ABE099_00880 [Paenibacillus turicensis]|uniref:hypothetical protein n=1 Tax=Paenibacillus turicensis TaxID=160487 RepID=UPI003D279CD6